MMAEGLNLKGCSGSIQYSICSATASNCLRPLLTSRWALRFGSVISSASSARLCRSSSVMLFAALQALSFLIDQLTCDSIILNFRIAVRKAPALLFLLLGGQIRLFGCG